MTRQISTFSVGETILGLDILIVKEVYRHMEVTPIPDAPVHMSGLMNLRGRVVTVIDLETTLGHHKTSDGIGEKRLLIMKTNNEVQQYQASGLLDDIKLGDDILGFLIDRMDDVLTVEDDNILPTPPNLDTVDRQLIEGVIKLRDRLVLLLDINAVLERILVMSQENEER